MKLRQFPLLLFVNILFLLSGCRTSNFEDKIRDGADAFVKGDLPKAIQIKREIVQARPDNPVHRFDLAMILKEAGRKKEAIAEFEILSQSSDRVYANVALRQLKELGVKK